ncbi:acyl carrier protein [Mesorhizobium sp. ORS 3428]|uniref:acyl carrier protein n=1 Tax=Mesorhizobium sp. ORS 3428 TaxID=540997 RepID=UPI0005044D31|nr:acyl carrier protein [Mesorhizobium sp. ORS 3428]OHV76177.1 nodulation protein NodF [Mesorhizobium sp. ORS 3428]CDX38543.1 Nodulation protein F [Mesorhizobium sp. SOD10]
MTDQLPTEILAEICKHAEPDANPITLEAKLTDLGIHSLAMADILFGLETKYGIEIETDTADTWSNLQNVGSVVEAVRALNEQ